MIESHKKYRDTPKGRAWRKRQQEARKERVRLLLGFIAAWKAGTGCSNCGYKGHPSALDFDHRPGTQKIANISHLIRRGGIRRLLEELEKCDLLCANCHREETAERAWAA